MQTTDRALSKASTRLAKAGLALFVMGLILGGLIPVFENPRLALSAHLTAVQSGTALIVFGLLWDYTGLNNIRSSVLSNAIWISAYSLSAGLSLGAAFGGSRLTPLASPESRADSWQEILSGVLIMSGSVGMLIASSAWLFLWLRARSENPR